MGEQRTKQMCMIILRHHYARLQEAYYQAALTQEIKKPVIIAIIDEVSLAGTTVSIAAMSTEQAQEHFQVYRSLLDQELLTGCCWVVLLYGKWSCCCQVLKDKLD